MVFGVAVLNRPVIADVVKKHYGKVLDLLYAELAREEVSGSRTRSVVECREFDRSVTFDVCLENARPLAGDVCDDRWSSGPGWRPSRIVFRARGSGRGISASGPGDHVGLLVSEKPTHGRYEHYTSFGLAVSSHDNNQLDTVDYGKNNSND